MLTFSSYIKRLLAMCVSFCLVIAPLVPGIAAAACGGGGGGVLESEHNALEFGKVPIKSTKTLSNTFTDVLTSVTIKELRVFNPFVFSVAKDECKGKTLKPSEKCTIEMNFTPLEAGEYFGAVWVLSSTGELLFNLTLEGEGK